MPVYEPVASVVNDLDFAHPFLETHSSSNDINQCPLTLTEATSLHFPDASIDRRAALGPHQQGPSLCLALSSDNLAGNMEVHSQYKHISDPSRSLGPPVLLVQFFSICVRFVLFCHFFSRRR
jgi:hypothetical protein